VYTYHHALNQCFFSANGHPGASAISRMLYCRLKQGGIEHHPQLRLIPPVGYLDFLCLLSKAKLVLTDSGSIQEETTALGVPCLTLRENTERPITISQGTNLLVGTDPGKIVAAARDTLAGRGKSGRIPPLWDGHAAKRIVDILLKEVPRAMHRSCQ
jgi:UDP-N-acetylglucosamine 2-epimerase (non-hydrolysing)